ncbi:MAG: response regulator [Pseudomonadota bacterium]|nr:response regulator [Pseudomonadota bacterium]
MNLRVLVVDDEPLARRGILSRLSRHTDVQVVGEVGDGESALSAIATEAPDLVFMDVQMPGLSGLDTLRLLPPHQRPLTVFLTAYDRYALNAFEVHALDYLLKPIDDERFAETLDRARTMLDSRQNALRQPRLEAWLAAQPGSSRYATRFAVRSGHKVTIVATDELDWIEAMGDYAGLHAGERLHLLREPLHRLAQSLDPAEFVRIHRSTIVRVARIAEIQALPNRDSLLRLHNGTPLRASRTYGDDLRAALAGFVPALADG